MSKRGASTVLNHDNWDHEDEPEEAGTFSKAADDIIQKRVIKVARRRNPISSSTDSQDGGGGTKTSAFAGFNAFAKTPVPTTAAFNFLTSAGTDDDESKKMNGTATEPASTGTTKKNDYYARLKGLNESVTSWIQKHVSANPFVDLQPIFKDYQKYFDELEKSKTDDKPPLPKETTSEAKPSSGLFAFNNLSKPTSTPSTGGFSFGSTTASSLSSTTSGFSFGNPTFKGATNNTTSPSKNSAASFGSNQSSTSTISLNPSPPIETSSGGGFTFTNTAAAAAGGPETAVDDEPPKVEFTPVVEQDHIYTIRCKVFVMKDKAYSERGVGNLFLKAVPDSEKYQLIVRADTNLGNLLCNLILSESIPLKRMGKKDVMLVCVPMPDAKPPPVPVLLRVKTTEEADDLLATLQKYQK